jgi:uncharacterized membrane protein YccF (DUF307 family)
MLSGKIVKLNMRGIDRNRKGQIMRVLGNILWIILGGLAIAIGWAVVELILCISIIGIPLGIQAFKMAKLALWPFGAEIVNL